MPRPTMSLDMPEYSPELEYTLNLGVESTPLLDDISAPAPPRTRTWRSRSNEREQTSQKARSSAYDADGNLKIVARGRKAAARDCGICDESAVEPVRTLCCGALFCKQHIDDWIYGPAATGLCPACESPCVLPPSRSPSPLLKTPLGTRPRTPPASRSHSHPSSRSASPSQHPDIDTTDVETASATQAPKYRRPGADGLVRLLSLGVAAVLLVGALSRRGGSQETVVRQPQAGM
ncbi:hypothetical protein B0H16DRAFT_89404 [Mycena metata]|uniref:RING-type domain-containing protein n=1 Tax=Mycena metata TaxID=1033252 RepID=A0AAD7MZC0_9AGAR|nr:hypothetical protein B0H16DRAFT_89404 [Mycena metata]